MARKRPNVIHRWRRASQFFFLLALNPVLYGGLGIFRSLGICFPAMNCWACPAAAFGCPIGALGQFLVRGAVPFLALGLMVLAGAVIGRMICGWVCPFGLLQDLLHRVPSGRKFRLPKAVAYLKYPIFVVTVVWIPLQFGVARTESRVAGSDFFFCNYCPAGALEAAVPFQLGLGPATPEAGVSVVAEAGARAPGEEAGARGGEPEAPGAGAGEGGEGLFGDESTGAPDLLGGGEGEDDWLDAAAAPAEVARGSFARKASFFLGSPQMWVLYAFLLLFVFFRRPFCRGVCPIGAVFALLNRFSLLRLRVNRELCKDCNLCERGCPVENKIPLSPANQDCIRCLECTKNCQRGGPRLGLAAAKPREGYWE